jgi:hypothetical protein
MRHGLAGALVGVLALLCAPAAQAAAGLPMACEITRDQGWGEFYFRNVGTITVPEGSEVDWRTSSGKAGRLKLDIDIPPGKRQYMPAVFLYQWSVDEGATCTAVVASHPPTLVDQLRVQPNAALTQLLTKQGTQGKLLAIPCKYCDSQVLTSPSAVGTLQSPGTALLIPKAVTSAHAAGVGTLQSPGATLLTPKATSQQTASLPATYSFDPPKAPGGQRLHACQTVDGNLCGQPIADQFCQQQGYTRADGYNTEKRKGPAVTLSGEVCDKKKCKVFDAITCVK